MLIGLSGRMGSGKNTFADLLTKHYGYRQLAFADHLKKTAAFMTGLPLDHFTDPELKQQQLPGFDCTSRKLQELLGTECGRAADANFWVKTTMSKIDQPDIVDWVITDLRFPNEAAAVKAAGGFVVRINRANNPTKQSYHVSNTYLDNYAFDHVVNNNHGLAMLRALASFCVAELKLKSLGID